MRVLIVADIEGAVGIYKRSQCYFLKPDFQYGRNCLTEDVNAIVEGCVEGGADSVLIRDTHETGRNIILEKLRPGAEYIGGHFREPFPLLGDPAGTDLVFLVASHARSGNAEAFFAHTFFGGFTEVRVNGQPVGESFIYGAALSELNIPVAFNSGDSHAISESLEFMPWMKTVVVPKEESFYNAPDAIKNTVALRDDLRLNASKAITERSSMKCPNPPLHPTWEVDVKNTTLAEKIKSDMISLKNQTLVWSSETYIEGFKTLFNLVQASFLAISS